MYLRIGIKIRFILFFTYAHVQTLRERTTRNENDAGEYILYFILSVFVYKYVL